MTYRTQRTLAIQIEISVFKWYCSMPSFNIFNITCKRITVFLPNVSHCTFYPMIVSFFFLRKAEVNQETISFIRIKSIEKVWYSWDKNRGKFIREVLTL